MLWYRKPLSSDTFSSFADGDPNKKEHEREVLEAMKVLRTRRVPQVAKMIRGERGCRWITKTMQQFGVNCRYLGLMRTYIEEPSLKDLCLVEMCARVLSADLKYHLRETAKKLGMSRKAPFFELATRFYNSILGDKIFTLGQTPDVSLWKSKYGMKHKLLKKYEDCLSEEEKQESFDMRQKIDVLQLIWRIEEKTGVTIKEQTKEKLSEMGKSMIDTFSFSNFDFEEIEPQTKGLSIISFSVAEARKKQADGKSSKEKLQLLQQAADIIEQTGMGEIGKKVLSTIFFLFILNFFR